MRKRSEAAQRPIPTAIHDCSNAPTISPVISALSEWIDPKASALSSTARESVSRSRRAPKITPRNISSSERPTAQEFTTRIKSTDVAGRPFKTERVSKSATTRLGSRAGRSVSTRVSPRDARLER